jgi:hypothetical protein
MWLLRTFCTTKKYLRPSGTKINNSWYLVKQQMGAATFHRFQLWVWSNDLLQLFRTTGKSIWHRITDAISCRNLKKLKSAQNSQKLTKEAIQINFSSDFVLNASPKILCQIDFPVALSSRVKSLDRTQSWNLWKLATPICCFTRYQKLFTLVPADGLRYFFGGAKCSQQPHLFWCYEAKYTLKTDFYHRNRVFRSFLKKNQNISKTKGLGPSKTSCICHDMMIAVILHLLSSS